MHPIERLRYVARANGVSPEHAVRESASALRAFAHDPHALVTACRRMIDRQPGIAPLWWMGARLLTAADPTAEVRRVLDDLAEDTTRREVEFALPPDSSVCVLGWPDIAGEAILRRGDLAVRVVDVHCEGGGFAARLVQADVVCDDIPQEGMAAAIAECDLLLIEASAATTDEALCVSSSLAAAAVAGQVGVPVWLVLGIGRSLPRSLYDALIDRVGDGVAPWLLDDERVSADMFDLVLDHCGARPVDEALATAACPVAPELLKRIRGADD